jgi:hypothetical protein
MTMRIWLSLVAIGLGGLVGGTVLVSGRFDLWSLAIGLFLVAGGLRLWRRRRIEDGSDD